MGPLQNYLNDRETKKALLYLYLKAVENADGGGARHEVWTKGFDPISFDQRVQDFLSLLDGGQPLLFTTDPPQGIEALAALCALDRHLAEEFGAKRPALDDPIQGPGHDQAFWILPRRGATTGYLHKNPTKLDFFHPHHVIIPSRLEDGLRSLAFSPYPTQAWMAAHGPWREALPKPLRIALASFDDGCRLQSQVEGRHLAFHSLDNEAERLNQARKLVREAEALGADILLFPELTLSPELQQQIRRDLLHRALDAQKSRLQLIGLGSFHEHCPHSDQTVYLRNRACLVSGEDGRLLLHQDKINRASFKDQDEGFHPAAEVNALITPIGLITLAICKDLFDESTAWIWRRLAPDWLLIPSMSNELQRHQDQTADLWKRHRCISAVANQAMTPTEPTPWSYLHHTKVEIATTHLMCFELEIGP